MTKSVVASDLWDFKFGQHCTAFMYYVSVAYKCIQELKSTNPFPIDTADRNDRISTYLQQVSWIYLFSLVSQLLREWTSCQFVKGHNLPALRRNTMAVCDGSSMVTSGNWTRDSWLHRRIVRAFLTIIYWFILLSGLLLDFCNRCVFRISVLEVQK